MNITKKIVDILKKDTINEIAQFLLLFVLFEYIYRETIGSWGYFHDGQLSSLLYLCGLNPLWKGIGRSVFNPSTYENHATDKYYILSKKNY